VQVTVGFLTLNAGSATCLFKLSDVMHATTAGAVILLVLLSTLIISITIVSFMCLKRARRWPFSRKCRMEPNVLYTANDPFLPFDAAAAAGQDGACNRNCTLIVLTCLCDLISANSGVIGREAGRTASATIYRGSHYFDLPITPTAERPAVRSI